MIKVFFSTDVLFCFLPFPGCIYLDFFFLGHLQLFSKASRFQRVQVRYVDVLVPFGILMGLNVLLMTLWTALDPLHWERIHLEYDDFGRVLESTGHCTSNHFSAFMIPLLAVDGCAMVLAIWQAYVGHAITTEFNESQYIASKFPLLFIFLCILKNFYVLFYFV